MSCSVSELTSFSFLLCQTNQTKRLVALCAEKLLGLMELEDIKKLEMPQELYELFEWCESTNKRYCLGSDDHDIPIIDEHRDHT